VVASWHYVTTSRISIYKENDGRETASHLLCLRQLLRSGMHINELRNPNYISFKMHVRDMLSVFHFYDLRHINPTGFLNIDSNRLITFKIQKKIALHN